MTWFEWEVLRGKPEEYIKELERVIHDYVDEKPRELCGFPLGDKEKYEAAKADFRAIAHALCAEEFGQFGPGGPNCQCRRCLRDRQEKKLLEVPLGRELRFECPECGDEKCPHAIDHDKECTGD